MTKEQEKDLAQIERDISAAEIAITQKAVYEKELLQAEAGWLLSSARLEAAIVECSQTIKRLSV